MPPTATVNVLDAAAAPATRPALERLLSPRSVAIVGASATPGSLGRTCIENLERFGYKGDVHLINPNRPDVLGRPCLKSARELPMGVDCAVMAVPVAGILDAVNACAERGVGGIVIFSAGFAEMGPEGAALQDAIAAVAKAHDMAIEGPNCLGYINYRDGVALSFSRAEPVPVGPNPIAVLSQSGAMSTVIRAGLHSRGLGVSLTVSTGNEAVNSIEDFIELALDRADSKILALFIEHIRDPQRFLALAARAQREKVMMILLHPGQSAAARHSAQTHTGAMAGDYDLMRTWVERRGVLLVDTLEEMVDVTEMACRCPKPPTGGVSVLGESGAHRALTFDYCEAIHLPLPQPTGKGAQALDTLLPGLIHASNPLDLTATALTDPSLYGKAVEGLMMDGQAGTLLVVIILTTPQMAERKMPPILAELANWAGRWNTVFAMLGDETPIPEDIIEAVRAAGVPFHRSPERALRAINRYAEWVGKAAAQPVALPPRGARLPSGMIVEHAAKDILQSGGLAMPPRALCRTKDEALAAVAKVGFPLVMKIQSPQAPHKSDIGGVMLNIRDEAALSRRWDEMQAIIADKLPGAHIHGVLLESMSEPGLELILGARNDPQWGALIAVGMGGVEAEVTHDIRHLTPESTLEEIEASLLKLKRAALLGPFRGRQPRDVKAVAKAVHQIGQFMQAHPEVRELDVNPLTVLADGRGAVALDVLMVCD